MLYKNYLSNNSYCSYFHYFNTLNFVIHHWFMLSINGLIAIKKQLFHFSLLGSSRLKAPQLTEHLVVTENSLGKGTGERALKTGR